jgi:capsule polysaccharide export protein KpsE/RkpR
VRETLVRTSQLHVRCDGLQQYPHKLSIKKIQDFLLIVSAICIIYFLIWLTDVIIYYMQICFGTTRPMKLEESSQRLNE